MAIDQEQHWFAMEALFCEEERWDEGEGSQWIAQPEEDTETKTNPHLHLQELFEQDVFYEDEEINELILKEKTDIILSQIISNNQDLSQSRYISVKWVTRVGFRYRFSPATTILAVSYFDRFLSTLKHQRETPWMAQLLAVACLSLAAKMEEIKVPLLLDFQVDESRETQYMFEAKTIQRMELVVLSTLQWRMNPITPVSFLDYMARKLDLWHREFFHKCHLLLQSIAADCRYTRYFPSVLAAASIIRVAEMDHCFDSHELLMGVLKISGDELMDCCKFIADFSEEIQQNPRKRRKQENYVPGSPSHFLLSDSQSTR